MKKIYIMAISIFVAVAAVISLTSFGIVNVLRVSGFPKTYEKLVISAEQSEVWAETLISSMQWSDDNGLTYVGNETAGITAFANAIDFDKDTLDEILVERYIAENPYDDADGNETLLEDDEVTEINKYSLLKSSDKSCTLMAYLMANDEAASDAITALQDAGTTLATLSNTDERYAVLNSLHTNLVLYYNYIYKPNTTLSRVETDLSNFSRTVNSLLQSLEGKF